MNEIPLQVPADLKKVETQSKGKLKLTFVTQENIPADLRSRMMELCEEYGWLSFLKGEKQIKADQLVNLPEITKMEDEEKSPSQRLRGTLFILWEQKGQPTETFEQYYRMHYERIIDAYKEKLT